MNRVEVELNLVGINAVMKSEGVKEALQQAGETIAKEAKRQSGRNGAEFAASTHKARWIAVTNVYPANEEGALRNYQTNALAKAFYHAVEGGGGG